MTTNYEFQKRGNNDLKPEKFFLNISSTESLKKLQNHYFFYLITGYFNVIQIKVLSSPQFRKGDLK